MLRTMVMVATLAMAFLSTGLDAAERLSRLTGEVSFKPGDKVAAADQNQNQQPSITQQTAPLTPDALHWSLVKDTVSADLLREFIARYPDSLFRADAEKRLKELVSKTEPEKANGNTESAAAFLDTLLPTGTSERYSLTLPKNLREKVADGLKREGYLTEAVGDYVKNGADQFALRFAVLKFQQAEGLSQTGYLTRVAVIRLLSRDSGIQQLAATQKLLQPDDNQPDNTARDQASQSEDPATAFGKLSLSRIERLRIARTLDMMGLADSGFPEEFVENGSADDTFVQAIKAFQRGRGFAVTGYPSADQVLYLVSLGDKKSSWELHKEAVDSEANLELGELKLEQVVSRTKLALGDQGSSDDAWRSSLKRWQARNGFEATGFLSREVFARLLDEPVHIPLPTWTTDVTFNDWGYWQNAEDNDKRCYIWTFALSLSGRYAELEMPDMTMSRVPKWPKTHMSATYVKTRWFDTSRPLRIIIDGRDYETTSREGYYWPRITGGNEYSDEIMRALSRTTNEVTVVGASLWGGELRMEFSASGFTSAFKHMDSQCGRNSLNEWLR